MPLAVELTETMESAMPEVAPEKISPPETAQRWWAELTQPTESGQRSHRGELAELRRCKTLDEVLFARPYHVLYYRTAAAAAAAGRADNRLRVAAMAGVLAHLKGDVASSRGFAAYLAMPKEGRQGPRVSELRFQRLMKEKSLDEFYPALLRIIHLVGEKAPVRDLVEGIYFWSESRRREWTFAYYNQLLDNEKP